MVLDKIVDLGKVILASAHLPWDGNLSSPYDPDNLKIFSQEERILFMVGC